MREIQLPKPERFHVKIKLHDMNDKSPIHLGTLKGYISDVLIAVSKSIGVGLGDRLHGIVSWIQNGGIRVLPQLVESAKDGLAEFDIEVVSRVSDCFNVRLIQELLKRGSGVGIGKKHRGWYEIIEFS